MSADAEGLAEVLDPILAEYVGPPIPHEAIAIVLDMAERRVLTSQWLAAVRAAAVEEALREAADEMEAVISDGDVAEVAAPVSGEVGRASVVAKRDALYEEPAEWLRSYAALRAAQPTTDVVCAHPPGERMFGRCIACGAAQPTTEGEA